MPTLACWNSNDRAPCDGLSRRAGAPAPRILCSHDLKVSARLAVRRWAQRTVAMGASQRMRTVGRDLVGGARWLRPHDLLVPLHLQSGGSAFLGRVPAASSSHVACAAQRSGRRSAAPLLHAVCGTTGPCAPELGGAATQPVHVGKAAAWGGGTASHWATPMRTCGLRASTCLHQHSRVRVHV